MDNILNFLTVDFWLGIVGAFFATGYLTQVFKQLVNSIIPGPDIAEGWKYVIAFPCAFIVATLFQVCQVLMANAQLAEGATPFTFQWGMIPALTIIYAAASTYIYRFVIKRFLTNPVTEDTHSDSDMR